MARLKSVYATGQLQVPTCACGGELVHIRSEITLAAAIAAGDVFDFGPLIPSGYVATSFVLENDDCDTGTTLTGDLGVLNAAGTGISTDPADGTAWLAASTALQAQAVTHLSAQAAAKQVAFYRMTQSAADRTVAFVASAAGAGGVGSKIAVHLTIKAA